MHTYSFQRVPVWFCKAVLMTFCIGGSGCAAITGPDWSDPGPIQTQKRRAIRFDPYLENDIGPPIDGGRPRDYLAPIPQVERARWWAPIR
jgi:hypothetical protein